MPGGDAPHPLHPHPFHPPPLHPPPLHHHPLHPRLLHHHPLHPDLLHPHPLQQFTIYFLLFTSTFTPIFIFQTISAPRLQPKTLIVLNKRVERAEQRIVIIILDFHKHCYNLDDNHLILPPKAGIILDKGVKRVETGVRPDQTSTSLAQLRGGDDYHLIFAVLIFILETFGGESRGEGRTVVEFSSSIGLSKSIGLDKISRQGYIKITFGAHNC